MSVTGLALICYHSSSGTTINGLVPCPVRSAEQKEDSPTLTVTLSDIHLSRIVYKVTRQQVMASESTSGVYCNPAHGEDGFVANDGRWLEKLGKMDRSPTEYVPGEMRPDMR